MKPLLSLLCLSVCVSCWAADGVTSFQSGLQAFQSNGADALLSLWYNPREEADRVAKLRERLIKITQDLGPVLDTQVFAPHDLGTHVQRLYGAIYFQKRPLWIRAEYYSINGRNGFIALDFSLSADDILPLAWAKPRD